MSMNSSLRSLPHFQVHESSKSDKYEDTGGFSRSAGSCWVFIWSDLGCFSNLLNPVASPAYTHFMSFHVCHRRISTRSSWVDSKCPKITQDTQIISSEQSPIRRCATLSFLMSLVSLSFSWGWISHWNSVLLVFVNMKHMNPFIVFSCSPSMVLI